jgi:hypothetical protein
LLAAPSVAGKPHYEIAGNVVKIADGASNAQRKIRFDGVGWRTN